MARSSYSGNKRRREIAKKKKREEKLARKHGKDDGSPSNEVEDTSYLEYLHPGGLPDTDDESEDDSEDDSEDEDE